MKPKNPPFIILGHRGCMGEGKPPENTIPAFEYALNAGADGIEIDVHLSQDRWLVVIHDKTVNRTTDKKGRVIDKKLFSLKRHDAGNGVVIPTLEEALNLVEKFIIKKKKDLIVNIELKGEGTVDPVCDIIRSYTKKPNWSYRNFIISSFHFDMLRDVYKYNKKIPIGVLLNKKIRCTVEEIIKEIEFVPYSLHPMLYSMPYNFISDAHKNKVKVICWGIENIPTKYKHRELTLDGILSMHIDGIITNNPIEKVKAFKKSMKNNPQ